MARADQGLWALSRIAEELRACDDPARPEWMTWIKSEDTRLHVITALSHFESMTENAWIFGLLRMAYDHVVRARMIQE